MDRFRDIINLMDLENHEVEARFKYPSLYIVDQLYSAMKPVKEEMYLEEFWFIELVKYRSRIKITEHEFNQTPVKCMQGIGNSFVSKKRIKDEDFGPFSLHEAEEKTEHLSEYAQSSRRNKMYRVVNNVVFDLKSLLVDIKYTTRCANNQKIFYELIKPEIVPTLLIEVEFKHKDGIDLFLNQILPRILGISSISDLVLPKIQLPVELKTHTCTIQSLVDIQNYENLFITPKIDGRLCIFRIEESKCLVQFAVGSPYIRSFLIKKIKNKLIEGYGEFIQIGNQRVIFPILIVVDGITQSRTTTIPNIEGEILFASKPISHSFKTPEQFFTAVIEILQSEIVVLNQSVPTDGAIMGNLKNQEGIIVDKKIKLVNTVDFYAVFDYGPNSTVIITKGTSETYIKLILYAGNSGSPKHVRKETIPLLPGSSFDQESQILKLKLGNQTHLIFNKSIIEIGPNQIQSRQDKTSLLLDSKRYFGNSYNVATETTGISLEILNRLASNYLNAKLDFAAEIVHSVKIEDPGILNVNKIYYATNNRQIGRALRTFNNYIVSQLLYSFGTKFRSGSNKTILDIDGGRGGIMQKAYFLEAVFLLITDSDSNALAEASRRIDEYRTKQPKVYKYATLHATPRSLTYESQVRGHIRKGTKIDLINYSFAIHFSLDPGAKEELPVMINLRKLASPGTRVIVTCLAGEIVTQLLSMGQPIKYNLEGTSVPYTITATPNPNIISVLNPMSSVEPMEEYVLTYQVVIDHFEHAGFRLIDSCLFSTLLDAHREFFTDRVDQFETKTNTIAWFKTVREAFAVQDDSKELSKIHRYFVFVKN